ncbi:MAG: Crp/Fnr family transcriptional regulator [Anaerolineales bacterium]
MAETMRALRDAPIFEGVSDRILSDFTQSSRIRALEKGEILFSQTDPADTVYIVRSGCIAIFLATLEGRELVINEMHRGDCFGELSLITDQPRSTGALARESSEVISIPRDVFLKGLEAEPELMRRVLETTALRLRVSSERESALAFLDSSARIAKVLLQLDQQADDEGVISVTQEDLAQYVGLARQTVAQTLGEWRRLGWVETGRVRIVVKDREALERLASAIEG